MFKGERLKILVENPKRLMFIYVYVFWFFLMFKNSGLNFICNIGASRLCSSMLIMPWWPQPAHVKDSLAATTSRYMLFLWLWSQDQWPMIHLGLPPYPTLQVVLQTIFWDWSVSNKSDLWKITEKTHRTTMFPGLSATTKADLFPPTRRSPRSLDSQPHFETDQKSWILGKHIYIYIYPHWIPKNIMTHIQKKT